MESDVETKQIEKPKKVTDFLYGVFVGVIIASIPLKGELNLFTTNL